MTKVGKYELVRKLATGGMAEVFLARFEWARGLEKTVVVKRILQHLAEDPHFIEMFFTEAQLAAQLSHPNIAQIIEFGESEGVCFLSMEYVDGPSLRSLIAAARAAGTGIALPYCGRIVAFCCEALAHAHELKDPATGQPLGLVHRDVSPENILISRTGSVKLVDFGIAKAATQSHHTKTGMVKGKLAYMPPEQIRAEPLDRRADIFALGAVLYELITGQKLYKATNEIALIHAILYEEPVPLRALREDVPPELERIVNKALAHDRDQRWPDCRAMHAALEKYLLAAQQSVSALQIAELVEKHHPAPDLPERTPQRPLTTPSQQRPVVKTPEPWRAERTPAAAIAPAQLQEVELKTGTDGGGAGAEESDGPVAEPARSVEKTEVSRLSAVPEPARPAPAAVTRPPPPPAPLAPGPARPRRPAKKSPPWVIPAIAGAALLILAVGVVSEWPRGSPPEQPRQVERVEPPKPAEKAPPETTATAPAEPAAPAEPTPSPLPPAPVKASKSRPPRAELPQAPVPRAPDARAERLGKLQLRTRPESHVTIDGVSRGDTPIVDLPLGAGKHTVSLVCDRQDPRCAQMSQPTHTETFTIEPDKTFDLKHFFK